MASERFDGTATTPLVANDAASRWRVLLAHDGSLPTCDHLFKVIAEAMDDVQVLDAPSTDAARAILRTTAVDVCFVCLDLPPSPVGGIKFAQELVRAGCPQVLITRSLRWLPKTAAELRVLPWIAPEATATEVLHAIDEAVGDFDVDNQVTLDSSEDGDDEVPQRISEI
jgi:hypothetical protein